MKHTAKKEQKDRIICFCYSVPESVIIEAIHNGCSSLMDIRRETYASTGCAGCSEEVKKILKKQTANVGKNSFPPTGTDGGTANE